MAEEGGLYSHLLLAGSPVLFLAGLIGFARPAVWWLSLLTVWGALLGALVFPLPWTLSWSYLLVLALIGGYGGAQTRDIGRRSRAEKVGLAMTLAIGCILVGVFWRESIGIAFAHPRSFKPS